MYKEMSVLGSEVEVEESLQARAVLWQGLVEVHTHESLMTEVFAASKRHKKADQDVEEPPESQAEARDRRRKLETAVRKIHVNLGHPAVEGLIRILKHGNATEEAIATARDFKRDVCEQNRAPKLTRPATVPRDIQVLSEVGFDVKELLYYICGKTWAALNVVDGASSLQQMMPLAGNEENGETLRKAWDVGWRRPYGAPVRAKCDSARANTGAIMSEVLECDGVDFDVIPGEAHWLLGKAERHGSWFANILSKVIETVQPKNHQEWEQCVSTVCDQKNRLLRKHGHSPYQHVFGRDPPLPADLLKYSSDIVANSLALHNDVYQRATAVRAAARRAILMHSDDEAMRVEAKRLPNTFDMLLEKRNGQTGMCVKSSRPLKKSLKESKATRSTWTYLLRIKDRLRLHLAKVVSLWCRHLCLLVLSLLHLPGPLYLRTDPYLTLDRLTILEVDQAAKRKTDELQDPSLVARRVFDIEGKPLKRLRETTAVTTEGLASSSASGQAAATTVQPAVEEPPTRPADARQALLDSDPEHDELVAEAETEGQDAIITADVCLTSMVRTGEPCYEALLEKGRKDITEKLRPDLIEEILNAKMKEWQTVDQEKHAVRVCSLKESGEIKRTRPDRLVDTRFVMTIKYDPDGKELVKARWVARGFKDPDALKLVYWNQTAAPTMDPSTRSNHLAVFLGFILIKWWNLCYPCMAWITLLAAGSRRFQGKPWTKWRLDPCLFFLRDAQCKLCGILVVHVDDVLIAGEGAYFNEAVQRLKEEFPFRKWTVGEGEYCGSALYQDPKTFDISIRQTTPYQELKPITVRRRLPDFDVYLVKEVGSAVRHDQTPACSFLRDNKCYLDQLWNGTQAGYILGFTTREMAEGKKSPWSPAAWRSYRLKRVVGSTLAGETQALSDGIGHLEWLLCHLSEALYADFDIKTRERWLGRHPCLAVTDCKSVYDHLTGASLPSTVGDRRVAVDMVGTSWMVHFVVTGDHDSCRTFLITLGHASTAGAVVHNKSSSNAKVNASVLLGSKYDDQKIGLTYTLTTKRVQITGPAAIIDAAEITLVDQENRFTNFIASGDDSEFAGAPTAASIAVDALKKWAAHDYEEPAAAEEALEQEVLIGEILQESRIKLEGHPELYNRFRSILIREFTNSIEDGFETSPLPSSKPDASMGEDKAGKSKP
ncbi:unnamed protein product [Prorocentrum cordatum]|uniref:Reverse transcriptase Ty1/copia-type domain-containing protein n=1 Tax=Prorocentrum cordatum TaxID=2364126 RepID=A0ABN9RVQ5_9DINO|nr:unnamed protein product [Polarella glacialis]